MGLFFGRKNFAERHEEALLNYDCERSVGIILDFIQKMETLQETLRRGKRKQGVMAAQYVAKTRLFRAARKNCQRLA